MTLNSAHYVCETWDLYSKYQDTRNQGENMKANQIKGTTV